MQAIVEAGLGTAQWAAQALKNGGMAAKDVAKFLVNVLHQGADGALTILLAVYNLSLADAVKAILAAGVGSVQWAAGVLRHAGHGLLDTARIIVDATGMALTTVLGLIRNLF